MIFGLALKSLRAKPLKTFASVAAIAVAVAMLFCTFSFESAVYDYVYEVETADHGESDIIISTKSGGDRLALVQPLKELDGVEEVIPTLSVYALCERPDAPDEYVRLRGFEDGDVGALGGLELVSGSLDSLASHPDDVVISLNAAEHFGLGLGDMFTVSGMTAGGGKANFFVAAIAANTGVFAADSPFTVLGTAGGGIASLISPGGRAVYNEVYVRTEAGTDAAELAERISEMPEYKGLTVSECMDLNYIATRASNLAAPVTIAGVAVALLCFVGLVLVFTSGIADRRSYAARLALVGATKKRIFALFAIESAVMAAGGAVIGSALAVGALALLLHIVLASAASFSVNAALLFAAAAACRSRGGSGVCRVALSAGQSVLVHSEGKPHGCGGKGQRRSGRGRRDCRSLRRDFMCRKLRRRRERRAVGGGSRAGDGACGCGGSSAVAGGRGGALKDITRARDGRGVCRSEGKAGAALVAHTRRRDDGVHAFVHGVVAHHVCVFGLHCRV